MLQSLLVRSLSHRHPRLRGHDGWGDQTRLNVSVISATQNNKA